MTPHQERHWLRKWMKNLKRSLQLNKLERERGLIRTPEPGRLPK